MLSNVYSAVPHWLAAPLNVVEVGPFTRTAVCFGLGFGYVAAVLGVTPSGLYRDHPLVIRRRIKAATLFTFACPFVLRLVLGTTGNSTATSAASSSSSVLDLVGMTHSPVSWAALRPLLASIILFSGPIVQDMLNGTMKAGFANTRLRIVRNLVVGPLTEELVYRSYIMTVLLPALGPGVTILLSPLFFGAAHLHHYFGGEPLPSVLLQFGYTSLFGWFCAYSFHRTGNVWGVVYAHAFCNYMALPNFGKAMQHKHKTTLGICYVAGLLGFIGFTALVL